MDGEGTGNTPVGNDRGRGRSGQFLGLSEQTVAEKREAQVKEGLRECRHLIASLSSL